MKAAPRNEPRIDSQPADDDHEQHQERQVDVEGQRLRAAEVEEDQLGAGHAAVERRDPEGQELGRSGRTPMISAAMSRSRMAIQERPIRPAHEVLGHQGEDAPRARGPPGSASGRGLGPVTITPSTVRGGAVIVPDDA